MVADARRSQVTCAHCGLPVSAGLVETGAERQFCCGGCRLVFDTLHASGLDDDYYALRAQFEDPGAAEPSRASGRAFEAFDREAFQAAYVSPRTGADGEPTGVADVDFLLEGVQCAACVWLVERLPKLVPGVVDAQLRLRDSRVSISFLPGTVAVSKIARSLDRIGYPAHPPQTERGRALARRSERRHLVHMGVAAVCAGNAMLVAFALYAGRDGGLDPVHARMFQWIGLALGWLSILWPGRGFLRGAWAALRTRTGHLDLPIAIALVAGGLAGTWNTVTGSGEAYFDSLTVLVFLLLVGRYVQARQQRWAADAVDLTRALTPATCRVVRERDGEETLEEITTPELEPGDVVCVRPGEPFPADGVVVFGRSAVDRSLLSGEADPIAVAPGDPVHASSQNVASELRFRVTEAGSSSRVGRLMGLVEEGLGNKPAIERFTDRIAGHFVRVVCALAACTFAFWALRADVGTAIDHTVALLIVACPCALGLATPLTLAVAVGAAAREGILVKDSSVFERLAGRVRLLLDKTGTLTYGEARVTEFAGDGSLRGAIAAIESGSGHPLARALARDFEPFATPGERASDVEEKLDGGIIGSAGGARLRVGSLRHLAGHGHRLPAELRDAARAMEARGESVVGAALEGGAPSPSEVAAVIGLSDAPRHDSREVIEGLRARGWTPEILSGDGPGAVERVASALGIGSARGAVDPEGKLARVAEIRGASEESDAEAIVMVGDGVNDAAALAAADVGIAVHGGAEASLAAADVYTRRPGLGPLATLGSISVRTMRTIRMNLGVSLAYNGVGVSLAALGFMDPLVAAVLMPVSSVTVLALALSAHAVGSRRSDAPGPGARTGSPGRTFAAPAAEAFSGDRAGSPSGSPSGSSAAAPREEVPVPCP